MKKVVCKNLGEKPCRVSYRNCIYKIMYLQWQILINKEKGNVENKKRRIHRKNSIEVDIGNKVIEKGSRMSGAAARTGSLKEKGK